MAEPWNRRAFLGAILGGLPALALRREETMTDAARAYLATLDAPALARAAFAFADARRFDWHYVPRERPGLALKAMTRPQRDAALRLLRASLSAAGYRTVESIRSLENVLREIERGGGPERDPDAYHVAVFGEPAPAGVWGWRFEGHHVSLHWTVRDGRVLSATPQFLGSNPAEVRDGPLKGMHTLADEDRLGFRLLAALTDDQRRAAVVSERAPADIVTANARVAPRLAEAGVAYRALAADQQALLLRLLRQHASAQRPEVARARLEKVRAGGMDGVRFAWMGGRREGEGHYYRVQGPEFVVELDNTQNGANHIHTVWRELRGDWGLDALALHYRESDHHHGA